MIPQDRIPGQEMPSISMHCSIVYILIIFADSKKHPTQQFWKRPHQRPPPLPVSPAQITKSEDECNVHSRQSLSWRNPLQ